MANFGPLAAEIRFGSLGHPSKFQRLLHLGSVTARHSGSGRQPNFAALNRGCHLYSAGWVSRWALAHILVFSVLWKIISLYGSMQLYTETSCWPFQILCATNCCICAGSSYHLFCMSEGGSCEEELSWEPIVSTSTYAAVKQAADQRTQWVSEYGSWLVFHCWGDHVLQQSWFCSSQ